MKRTAEKRGRSTAIRQAAEPRACVQATAKGVVLSAAKCLKFSCSSLAVAIKESHKFSAETAAEFAEVA